MQIDIDKTINVLNVHVVTEIQQVVIRQGDVAIFTVQDVRYYIPVEGNYKKDGVIGI